MRSTVAARPYYARYTYNRRVYRRVYAMYYKKEINAIREILGIILKIVIPVSLAICSAMIIINVIRNNNINMRTQESIIKSIQTTEYVPVIIEENIMEETTQEIAPHVQLASQPIIISELDDSEYEDDNDIYVPDYVPQTFDEMLGMDEISIDEFTLRKYDLPNVYYPELTDWSSFQPWMDYHLITNKKSQAYAICNSDKCYTDSDGLRRYQVSDDQFSIDGIDDYVVALGTFYKPKGQAGLRYLIITTTGMFTVITGDEKSDIHTDDMNMFTIHRNGTCAGIIEWIVDENHLNDKIKRSGTVTKGPVEVVQGEILYIYGIE